MRKINKTNSARLVKQANGDWYIIWYDKSTNPSIRYREKFDMNRIKDVGLKQAWADKILAFLNNAFLNGESPNTADVKKGLLDDKLTPTKTETFKEHLDEHIELRKPIRAKATIKSLTTSINLLAKFAKDILQKPFPDYADFDAIFPIKFQSYCFSEPRLYSANHAAKRMDHVRQFLGDAVELGKVPVNSLWTSKKYHFKTVEVDDIALTMSELERIHKLHTEGVHLAVKDNFVFACLVGGLRYSDFSKIKATDFVTMEHEGKKIKMVKIATTQKTKDKVVVPLHPFALQILERNGGTLPRCPVNQVFNRYIKEIAKKAGLDDHIELRENTGGKTKSVLVERYTCISAHPARRTFATIGFLEWKVPVSVLMQITGHATEAQFFKYIKVRKEIAAFDLFRFMQ